MSDSSRGSQESFDWFDKACDHLITLCRHRDLIALRNRVWLGLGPDRAQGSMKAGSRPLRAWLSRATSLFRPGALGEPEGWHLIAAGTDCSVSAFGSAQPHLCPCYSSRLKVIPLVMYCLRLSICPTMLSCHCYSQEQTQILWSPIHSINMHLLSTYYVLGLQLNLGDFTLILSSEMYTSPTTKVLALLRFHFYYKSWSPSLLWMPVAFTAVPFLGFKFTLCTLLFPCLMFVACIFIWNSVFCIVKAKTKGPIFPQSSPCHSFLEHVWNAGVTPGEDCKALPRLGENCAWGL